MRNPRNLKHNAARVGKHPVRFDFGVAPKANPSNVKQALERGLAVFHLTDGGHGEMKPLVIAFPHLVILGKLRRISLQPQGGRTPQQIGQNPDQIQRKQPQKRPSRQRSRQREKNQWNQEKDAPRVRKFISTLRRNRLNTRQSRSFIRYLPNGYATVADFPGAVFFSINNSITE